MASPFLSIPPSAWVASNDLCFAIPDRYPVSEGHTLVIPRRAVPTWFDATLEEQQALMALVAEVKASLDAGRPKPSGYNIGINVGEAAGQTVMHLHVHVIPRYEGDVPDPRGGVRHVIPGKGNYLLSRPQALVRGGDEEPLIDQLRRYFPAASRLDILSAFVQDSGLAFLQPDITSARRRGASVRILTGDYLAISQVQALRKLLDWTRESTAERSQEAEANHPGGFEARVVETASIGGRAFHPKCWFLEGADAGQAWVGSSNVSRSALKGGIEWSLRLDRERDPRAYGLVVEGFEAWWKKARPLDEAWIDRYARRVHRAPFPLPPGEQEAEPLAELPPPHRVQERALQALVRARMEGRKRALVVMATGLGKTLLAALDFLAFRRAAGREIRALFVAHRAELLGQAVDTFRKADRELKVSWCVGEQGELTGDFVVASVQKLAGARWLEALREQRFDYVVVDEVHHAHAPSYRKVLVALGDAFVLGLTATPERADAGDVLGLFDDHVAFEAPIGEGIASSLLVPFHYFGIKDTIDYAHVPWRNRRFDPAVLAEHAATGERMAQLWRAWEAHPGTRTLVFCVSIAHAEYAARWLREEQGLKAVAVHSGPGTADRAQALRELAAGTLPVLCTVDLFNEGIDVREIDRVVMLRPTESPVIFLQQLGRGLRISGPEKEQLTVIDFVGNHRSFLDKVRTLASLGERASSLRDFIDDPRAAGLPAGCRVELEVEAKALLEQLLPRGASEVERMYQELRDARAERPRAGELHRLGANLRTLRVPWFEFVAQEGDLTGEELATWKSFSGWFETLQTTAMTRSFKMVTLQALLDAERLHASMPIGELGTRAKELLLRSPELFGDVAQVRELGDARTASAETWTRYWRTNPVQAWTGTPYFALEGAEFRFTVEVPQAQRATFDDMTAELVDLRLAQYRQRRGQSETDAGAFTAKVTWNQRDPILKLPNRTQRPDVPRGETPVRLPDGAAWTFRLMAEFCNVARPVGAQRNQLPDLLRRWFGPRAGMPGTTFTVRFTRGADGWQVEPVDAQVLPFLAPQRIRAFPSLRAAAGAVNGAVVGGPDEEEITLPYRSTPSDDLFAVRAVGDSMDGGREPIKDGDWLVMRFARGASLSSLEGRVVLVQVPEAGGDGYAYQLKRLVGEGAGWTLRSDNPARKSYAASDDTTPIAVLVEHPRQGEPSA